MTDYISRHEQDTYTSKTLQVDGYKRTSRTPGALLNGSLYMTVDVCVRGIGEEESTFDP